MSQKQNDNWHIDFASKVQEKSDRKKAISSSGTSGSKTSNDDEDDFIEIQHVFENTYKITKVRKNLFYQSFSKFGTF